MRRTLLAALSLCCAATAHAQPLPPAAPSPADPLAAARTVPPLISDETPAPLLELLERSGSARGLLSLPGTVGRLVMRAEKLNDAMSAALIDALVPRSFYARVLRELRKGYDATQVATLLAWYRTPLGVRVSAMTKAASDESVALRRRIEETKKAALDPARAKVVRQLIRVEAPLETLRGAAQALFRGLMRLARRALPPERLPSGPPGSASSDKAQEAFVPLYLAIYEALSLDELRALLTFTRSPEARWLDALERRAIAKAMEGAGILMGRAMLQRAAERMFRRR